MFARPSAMIHAGTLQRMVGLPPLIRERGWIGAALLRARRAAGLDRASGWLRRHTFGAARRLYAVALRYRVGARPAAQAASERFERAAHPGGIGERLVLFAFHQARRRRRRLARAALGVLQAGLVLAAQAHLAAGQRERSIRAARILALLFRPLLHARRDPATSVYLQVLFQAGRFSEIIREFPREEQVDAYYIGLIAGVAHLYRGNLPLAKFFLRASIASEARYALAHRMLGRTCLAEGDEEGAAACFATSVALSPNTVMAHQNYAGRYDVGRYVPKAWELQEAGTLLIYDNLLQFAEDLFLQGQAESSFVYYQRALRHQARSAADAALPAALRDRVADACPRFEPRLPVRILPYEWVTQFGHLGLLDSRV